MHLYLLRHAEAVPRQHDDPTRELTPLGRREVENVAQQFKRRGIALDACFHSPYVRTTQTTELFLQHCNSPVMAQPLALLTPEHRASAVLQFLAAVQADHVLLVTHNPLVSELLAVLTDGDIPSMHIVSTSELNALHCDVVGVGQAELLFRLQARN